MVDDALKGGFNTQRPSYVIIIIMLWCFDLFLNIGLDDFNRYAHYYKLRTMFLIM